MYRPAAHAADERTAWRLLAEGQTGHLVTSEAGALDATLLPYLALPDEQRVVVHFARANPQWRTASGTRGLFIVTGAEAYVSPSYYETKRDTGKVVPTWNYTVVHAHGVLRVHEDPGWLRDAVDRLTDQHEQPRTNPWSTTDAPPDFIDRNLKAIVGVELLVDRVEAKQKLSQNRSQEDFAGVIGNLSQGPAHERAVAEDMANLDTSTDGPP